MGIMSTPASEKFSHREVFIQMYCITLSWSFKTSASCASTVCRLLSTKGKSALGFNHTASTLEGLEAWLTSLLHERKVKKR